jgi:WD40 repeat protein
MPSPKKLRVRHLVLAAVALLVAYYLHALYQSQARIEYTFDVHSGPIQHIAVSHSGKYLASCCGRRVAVHDLATKAVLHLWTLNIWCRRVAISDNDERIAFACREHVEVKSIATGACLAKLEFGDGVSDVAFLPDGDLLVAENAKLIVYDKDTWRPRETKPTELHWYLQVAVERTSGKVLASDGRSLVLWDRGTQRLLDVAQRPGSEVRFAAFSADAKKLVGVSDAVHVVDLQKLDAVESTIPITHQRSAFGASASKANRIAILNDSPPNPFSSVLCGSLVEIVDLDQSRIVDRVSIMHHGSSAVALDPEGKTLFLGTMFGGVKAIPVRNK